MAHEEDYWTVDGSHCFGIIPGGLTPITQLDMPIWLHHGTDEWGAKHILKKHGHWLTKIKMNAPELVWHKCQQTGIVHDTSSTSKFTIAMEIAPSALMVLRFVKKDDLFTVVTFYYRDRSPEGTMLGRYVGVKATNPNPVFDLVAKPQPTIIVKPPRRKIEIPSA